MTQPVEYMSVGERIVIYRRRRGLSQLALANMIGRSEAWLSQVERGIRHVDRVSVLIRLAQVLKVTVEDLIGPAVEFLLVVKVAGWVEAGGGMGGIVERLATPWSMRSSHPCWWLGRLLIVRRAARLGVGSGSARRRSLGSGRG